MERKVTQALPRYQRRNSDQLTANNSSFITSRPVSTNSIAKSLISKNSKNIRCIHLDLTKVQMFSLPNSKNNSARNVDHRRVNSNYQLKSKETQNIGSERSKKENLSDKKLPGAPEISLTGPNKFYEKLVLAETKLKYFYNGKT